jgi:hypothetical protein
MIARNAFDKITNWPILVAVRHGQVNRSSPGLRTIYR